MNNKSKSKFFGNPQNVIAIICSIATLIMTGVSIFVYQNYGYKSQKLALISNEIDQLYTQKLLLEKIPKIKFTLQTLNDSGLPHDAFSSLNSIPAVIQIQHYGGDTAKGITIKIISGVEIISYNPDQSIEDYEYVISEDRLSMKIDVPQMRRNASISGTITCSSLSVLDLDVRIDNGIIEGEQEPHSSLPFLEKYQTMESIGRIDPRRFQTVSQIDTAIQELSFISMFGGIGDTSGRLYRLAKSFIISFIIGSIIAIIIRLAITNYEKRKINQMELFMSTIDSAIEDKRLAIGNTKKQVEKITGKPISITIIRNSAFVKEKWFYLTHKPNDIPNLIMEFENDKVISILYCV